MNKESKADKPSGHDQVSVMNLNKNKSNKLINKSKSNKMLWQNYNDLIREMI